MINEDPNGMKCNYVNLKLRSYLHTSNMTLFDGNGKIIKYGTVDEIINDFPHLPLGCRIELEEQTQAMILRNISRATMNANRLRQLINNFEHQSTLTLTLSNFLRFNPNVNLEDIYKLKMSWLELVGSANKIKLMNQI